MSGAVSTLLMVGGDRAVLAEHLWRLSRQPEEESFLIVVLTDDPGYHPDLGDEVRRTYLYFRHLNRRPEATGDIPDPSILELAGHEGEAHRAQFHSLRQVLVTPEQAELNVEDPSLFDLSLSEPQGEFLTFLEGLGLEMDKDALMASIRVQEREMLPLSQAFALVASCCEEWLALEAGACEAAWGGPLGALHRCLDAMGLWKHRLMVQHRSVLDRAIRHLHREPHHGGARLVLLLHKRVYRGEPEAPAWFLPVQRAHEASQGKHLTVLPPVKQYTVTVLLITYNRLNLLQRAVNQMLAQTHGDWRLRIYDHGSTDGTPAFCAALQKAHPERVQILRKDANGGAEAVGRIYQELMATTETELVLSISDDDWLFPAHLERTIGFLREHPWLGMVTAAYAGVKPDMALEFQYGPFYGASQVADPQMELQRALYAGVCPQGCVYRRALLRDFAADDTLMVEEGDAFAGWDYLVTTKFLAHYEAGYVNEVLTGITVSAQTAFAPRDFSYEFLLMMEGICGDYNGLFGPASYPHGLVHHFTQGIVLPMIARHFTQAVNGARSVTELDEALGPKRRNWEQFVQTHNRIYAQTNAHAPLLVG